MFLLIINGHIRGQYETREEAERIEKDCMAHPAAPRDTRLPAVLEEWPDDLNLEPFTKYEGPQWLYTHWYYNGKRDGE